MVEVAAGGEDALVGGRVRADRRTVTVSEEERKIRWWTYVVAAVWAAFLVGMARVVPPFREMFDEMWEDMVPVALPLWTRVVVGIPSAAWIALGVLVGGALIWKSKLVSAKTAGLIDRVAVVAWFLVGLGMVIALFLPLVWWPATHSTGP